MSFTTEHQPGVCAQPSDATRGFVFNHSMLRVKDPTVALDFYTRVMGMRLLRKLDFPEMSFSLYFLARPEDGAAPDDVGARTSWSFTAFARRSDSACRRSSISTRSAWLTRCRIQIW